MNMKWLKINVGPLALVAKEEVSKVKKTKEKVVVDSDSDATDDEWTSEDKMLIVSNPKKFFKNNFSKFGLRK